MVQGLCAFKSISKMYLHWGWFRLLLLSALFRSVFPLSVKLRSTNNVFLLQMSSEACIYLQVAETHLWRSSRFFLGCFLWLSLYCGYSRHSFDYVVLLHLQYYKFSQLLPGYPHILH